jgi:DNA-binding transcriptional ArsR family regulator
MLTNTLDNTDAINAHEALEEASTDNNEVGYNRDLFADMAATFAAIGDPTRLVILFVLSRSQHGMSATELCSTLKMSRKTMHGHMKHLVGVGQVKREANSEDLLFEIVPSARALMRKLIPAYFS